MVAYLPPLRLYFFYRECIEMHHFYVPPAWSVGQAGRASALDANLSQNRPM